MPILSLDVRDQSRYQIKLRLGRWRFLKLHICVCVGDIVADFDEFVVPIGTCQEHHRDTHHFGDRYLGEIRRISLEERKAHVMGKSFKDR